jgi:thiosulfate/3-mercaptopyruvate sulfurtransferase
MKKIILPVLILAAAGIIFAYHNPARQNTPEPWTTNQLLEPAALAATINNPSAAKPVIFSIGPAGLIKGATDIGPANEDDNLEKLKNELSKLPKNTAIVVYCGCCPFEHCPNIRPAFKLLNQMGFTNQKLLNLSDNLRVDWISKGYPMAD